MRKYEIMYIIRPTVDESGMKSVIEDVNKIFVDFDSKVVSTEEQGMKDLAYEIQKHRKGYYVLLKRPKLKQKTSFNGYERKYNKWGIRG